MQIKTVMIYLHLLDQQQSRILIIQHVDKGLRKQTLSDMPITAIKHCTSCMGNDEKTSYSISL